jgi:hypothetical protein
MKKLPFALRVILNVIFYIVYVLIFSLIIGFVLAGIPYIFGMNILPAQDPLFAKVQIFTLLFVLVVTLILRKYFYLNLRMYDEENEDPKTDFILRDE